MSSASAEPARVARHRARRRPRVPAPPQSVHDTDVRQSEGVADQTVLTRAAAGAQRREPGGGCGREPDLQACGRAGRP